MSHNKANIIHAFFMGVSSFILAVFFTYISDFFVTKVSSYIISLIFLLFIIIIHILFDIIGIAATAASETPFHAKSAKKIRGASQAVELIRNADKVASWTNDVVGDITGVVGGALGAAIVFKLAASGSKINDTLLNVTMAGLITSFTVTGKVFGKKFAITNADRVIFRVAQVIALLEDSTHLRIISNNRQGRKGKEKVN